MLMLAIRIWTMLLVVRQNKNQKHLQYQSISPEVEFQRLFPKVRINKIGVVDLSGKNKLFSRESSKNRLVTRSHVISPEEET